MITELNKSCLTCEFNFKGICASGGDYEYGEEIIDFDKQRDCWDIGIEYFDELIEILPEKDKLAVKRGFRPLSAFYDI
jgi:hypothetical protein